MLSEAQDSGIAELASKHDLALTKGELQLEPAALRADVGLLKWMFGVNTALVVGILLKLFST